MIFDETSPRTSLGLTITICIKITVNLSNVMFTYKGSLHDSQIIRQPNVTRSFRMFPTLIMSLFEDSSRYERLFVLQKAIDILVSSSGAFVKSGEWQP